MTKSLLIPLLIIISRSFKAEPKAENRKAVLVKADEQHVKRVRGFLTCEANRKPERCGLCIRRHEKASHVKTARVPKSAENIRLL